MEELIIKKRGRGRPKGSKNTKPSKPYERKAFVYSARQAAYVKYIIRKDKPCTFARMNELTRRLDWLRTSDPTIPQEQMQKIEQSYAEQCNKHEEWKAQNQKSPSKRLRRVKDDVIATKVKNINRQVIKQLYLQGLGLPDNYHITKISGKLQKRWAYLRDKIKTADDFLDSSMTGTQKLEMQCAYEAWMIRQVRPDINLNTLLMSLLRLYSEYYKTRYERNDEVVVKAFGKNDFDNFGEHVGILAAMRDFYFMLKDVEPVPMPLKVQHAIDRLVEMDEWCYIFDFLYPANRHKGAYPLTCVYHGQTNSLSPEGSIVCPVCALEQNKEFAEIQQEQSQNAMNMEENLKEEFIRKAREVHGDKYDYSLVEFVNWNRPVKIRCIKHDFVFPMAPREHLNGRGCKKCAHNQLKTTEEFVEELRAVYGDDYDYSLTRYVNHKTNVVCVCKKHNEPVIRTPQNLLKGWGCSLCMKEQGKTWKSVVSDKYDKSRTTERWTKGKFIEESRKIHGDKYDYTDVIYFNNDTDVAIRCRKCGQVFPAKPKEHIRGFGTCPNCYHGRKNHFEDIRLQTFIRRANEVHNNRYVYLDKTVRHDSLLHIACHLHGEFTLTAQEHLAGFGCPVCFPQQDAKGGMSFGERKVKEHLESINIKPIYNKEVTNPYNLSNRKKLRPDFQLLEHNAIIEFNGEQHYRFVEGIHATEEDFRQQQLRDEEMRMYCRDRKIRLLEIRYDEIDNIPELIDNFLQQ